MDETPEELEQIRRDAEQIDVHRTGGGFASSPRSRWAPRWPAWCALIMWMVDSKRNPCERVRDHFCKPDPASVACKSYTSILDESLHDESSEMRANIKAQCLSKIERLKDEDGITVK